MKKVQDSIYSPKFYRGLVKSPLSQAFSYFFLLSLVLALLRVAINLPIYISIQQQAPGFVASLVNQYPANLQLQLKDGQVSTNVAEPYFINQDQNLDGSPSAHPLFVIDTKTPFSPTQFNQYHVAGWLNKDAFYYQDHNSPDQIRSVELSRFGDTTVNQDVVRSWTNNLKPFYNLITPVIALGSFLAFSLMYTFYLLRLLFVALLIWLMAKLLKWGWSYTVAYKISLYAFTLAALMEVLLSIVSFWLPISGFPLMFTILTLAVVYVNFQQRAD